MIYYFEVPSLQMFYQFCCQYQHIYIEIFYRQYNIERHKGLHDQFSFYTFIFIHEYSLNKNTHIILYDMSCCFSLTFSKPIPTKEKIIPP